MATMRGGLRRRTRTVLIVAALVAVIGTATPVLAHNRSGTFASSNGCTFDWTDLDVWYLERYAELRERSSSCDSLQAKIRVKENGSWITRQDTDASFAKIQGHGATDMAWADHNYFKAGSPWLGFRRWH